MAMTIFYPVGQNLYVNLTNQCPCNCTFCIRQNGDGAYGSDSLWLEHTPTFEEVQAACPKDLGKYHEIVFCGYGEPSEAPDRSLPQAAARLSAPADQYQRLIGSDPRSAHCSPVPGLDRHRIHQPECRRRAGVQSGNPPKIPGSIPGTAALCGGLQAVCAPCDVHRGGRNPQGADPAVPGTG